jgi:hypothetical protein
VPLPSTPIYFFPQIFTSLSITHPMDILSPLSISFLDFAENLEHFDTYLPKSSTPAHDTCNVLCNDMCAYAIHQLHTRNIFHFLVAKLKQHTQSYWTCKMDFLLLSQIPSILSLYFELP